MLQNVAACRRQSVRAHRVPHQRGPHSCVSKCLTSNLAFRQAGHGPQYTRINIKADIRYSALFSQLHILLFASHPVRILSTTLLPSTSTPHLITTVIYSHPRPQTLTTMVRKTSTSTSKTQNKKAASPSYRPKLGKCSRVIVMTDDGREVPHCAKRGVPLDGPTLARCEEVFRQKQILTADERRALARELLM